MAGESDNTNTATIDATGSHTTASGANDNDSAAEAQQDAVLARILGGEESTPSNNGRVRDEHGRFSPKPDEKSAPSPEAKSKATPEPTAVPEGVKPDDYRKALSALQFDKVPQKYLDTLDPAEVVSWGLERAKNHADVARLKTDLAAAKKSTPVKPATEAKAEPPAEIDWGKLAAPVAQRFNDDVGVDITEPLTTFGKQIAETVQKSLEAKFASQQGAVELIQSQFRAQQQDAARTKLSEKFDLGKDERWQQVLEHREADKNEYANEHEAIAAACRHQFADEIIASYESKLKEQHGMRDKGQSTTVHTKTPPKAKTQDDVESEILDAIMSGDRDKAARLGRSSYRGANEEALVGSA